MGSDDQTPDEPRFGRRFTDEERAAHEAASAAHGRVDPSQRSDSPWPQYGQLSSEAIRPPSWPTAGADGAPAPSAPVSPSVGEQGAPISSVSPSGAPQGSPWAHGGTAAPQGVPGAPTVAGPAKLPSRVGPVLTGIGGVLLMLIVAPVVFIVTAFSGMNLSSMINSAQEVASGDTVTVDSSGGLIVSAHPDVYSCSVTPSAGGEAVPLSRLDSASGAWSVFGLAPGDYTLSCVGEAGLGQLAAFSGVSPDDITDGAISGLTWGSVVGLIGLVVLVVGIVWLVKVNRRRRAIVSATPWGPPLR